MMNRPVRVFLSLAAWALMACGGEAPPASADSMPSERAEVSAAAASARPPVCGDSVCCGGETPQSCPQDCTLGNKPYCYITPASASGTPSASVSRGSDAPVSAQACTTLRRPRHSSYWESFPIQPDGQVGGCETADDCTVTCWGEQTRNVIHSALFECTYCR